MTLRYLERRLVLERTEIGVQEAVDRLLGRWDQALSEGSAPPDPLDFASTLVKAGFHLHTTHRALSYLDECQAEASLPDRDRLLRVLLPAEGRGRPVS